MVSTEGKTDTGKWGTGAPRNQFPVANDFWGSGGGIPTKGKGGGKQWGKNYGKFSEFGKGGGKDTSKDRSKNNRKVKEEK